MESVDSFVAHSSSDLSIWGLFLMADPLVKSVMMLLVLASIWCWAIIVEKINSVRHERRNSDAFEDAFWSGGSADALYDEIGGKLVIGDDRRDCRRQPQRRCEQRLGNAGGDNGKAGILRLCDRLERIHDPPDGSEQADKGRYRADRGKEVHAALQPLHLAGDGEIHRAFHPA